MPGEKSEGSEGYVAENIPITPPRGSDPQQIAAEFMSTPFWENVHPASHSSSEPDDSSKDNSLGQQDSPRKNSPEYKGR